VICSGPRELDRGTSGSRGTGTSLVGSERLFTAPGSPTMGRLYRVPGTESTPHGPQEEQTKKVSLPAPKGLFGLWDDSSDARAARDAAHDISTEDAQHDKFPHSTDSSKRRSLFFDLSDHHHFSLLVSIVGPFLRFRCTVRIQIWLPSFRFTPK
jgi:hypothetical protein